MTGAERKAVYWMRVELRLCVDCAAGLQDGDGRRCLECRERTRLTTDIWRQRPGTKRKERNARRKLRQRHQEAGLCVDCKRPPEPGKTRCAEHLARHAAYQARHLDRREAAKQEASR